MMQGTEGLSEMLPPMLSRYQVGRLVQALGMLGGAQAYCHVPLSGGVLPGRLGEANRSYAALSSQGSGRLHGRHASAGLPRQLSPCSDDVPFLTNGHLHPYSDSGSHSEEF
jgi:hypothetical protein